MSHIHAASMHVAVFKASPGVALAIGLAAIAIGLGFIVYAARQYKVQDNQWDQVRRPWWFNLIVGLLVTLIGILTVLYNLNLVFASS